jgi:hypothetical protein
LLRDDLRGSVLEQLGDPQAIGVIDETSFRHPRRQVGRCRAAVVRNDRKGARTVRWASFSRM